jgi:hypothetical protein
MLYYLKGMKFNASDADTEMYILAVVINVLPEKKKMSQKKNRAILGDLTLTYYRLLVKEDLNQSSDTPRITKKCVVADKIS